MTAPKRDNTSARKQYESAGPVDDPQRRTSLSSIALEGPSGTPLPVAMKRELKAVEAKKRTKALLLVAPLAAFLLLVFIIPIGMLLTRAVQNPEVATVLPRTVTALSSWNREGVPPDGAYVALVEDMTRGVNGEALGALARRLNTEIPGYRSLVLKTARALPIDGVKGSDMESSRVRAALVNLDSRWSEGAYWQAIAKNSSPISPFYVLASIDLKQNGFGEITRASPDESIYVAILGRTLLIGLVVTVLTLALGYPLAYWISTLSERRANLAMILVLIPFWTSILVRVAAWIVLLQKEGLVNSALLELGVISESMDLLFNRTGVYVSMTHILLPFMILPLYSVMKSIPSTYQRAAVSLGSHPFAAFWRVYVPLTYPGVGAGALLVFILAIGYYITPALLGGPNDQMISYYVAYFTNVTINWGMACALGGLLLTATLLLYAIYTRFTGANVSLG